MLTQVVYRTRKALKVVRRHPLTAELAVRENQTFQVIHPPVEAAKRSLCMQVAVGSIVGGLVLGGNWSAAATIAGGWYGSKFVAHIAAGGAACVAALDTRLATALAAT